MPSTQIFLASSAELKGDRTEFEIFINRKNNDWVPRGAHLRLVVWEDFFDAMSKTRLQDEYNQAVRGCDVFVMLFSTKVGPYTEEEFETAFGQFQATRRPLIYTYFKDAALRSSSASLRDLQSLRAFQDKLKLLGHYQTVYEHTEGLLRHFNGQLDRMVQEGLIPIGPMAAAAGRAEPASGASSKSASPSGGPPAVSGAASITIGAGGVLVGGANHGNIHTGTTVLPPGAPDEQ